MCTGGGAGSGGGGGGKGVSATSSGGTSHGGTGPVGGIGAGTPSVGGFGPGGGGAPQGAPGAAAAGAPGTGGPSGPSISAEAKRPPVSLVTQTASSTATAAKAPADILFASGGPTPKGNKTTPKLKPSLLSSYVNTTNKKTLLGS